MISVCVLGPEVKEELVQALQKKLDDAVLDVMTIMLARNPMCKLMQEDVHVSHLSPVNILRLRNHLSYCIRTKNFIIWRLEEKVDYCMRKKLDLFKPELSFVIWSSILFNLGCGCFLRSLDMMHMASVLVLRV